VITTYGYNTYENYTGALLSDLQDIAKPPDTREVMDFRARLTDVKWDKIEPELKQFEKTMGVLLDQLEGVNSRFIGPVNLRNSLENEIREYDLCRNKIKGENRDLSHRYETLRSQQKSNNQALEDLDRTETQSAKKIDEVRENLQVKRLAYTLKEKEFKAIEDELETFQERTKEEMEKLYYDLENRAKQEMDRLQSEMSIIEQSIFRTKSNRDLQSEEVHRLNGKI
jgi:chromosome segregation ATPase